MRAIAGPNVLRIFLGPPPVLDIVKGFMGIDFRKWFSR